VPHKQAKAFQSLLQMPIFSPPFGSDADVFSSLRDTAVTSNKNMFYDLSFPVGYSILV
jgi:hypothetical protein